MCELKKQYSGAGLEILAFPCNQFGGQEPGSAAEIKDFATGKCPDAPVTLFAKIDVNGDNEAPLYTYLKGCLGEGLLGDDIKWNFAKFLVGKDGKPQFRYGPPSAPSSFEDDIKKLLTA
mmetsp:Transcript_660/g.1349  ORF Transcript_660/g.1349 Transcript_660/m.1349 type:complete len:119 (+) Transcript_660:504-860(+)